MKIKQIIIICLMLFCTTTLQAQLSPNFYSQFKVIATAKWEEVIGKEISNINNEGGYSIKYESTKKIDGFDIFGFDYDNMWYDYGIEITAILTKPNPLAPQLFDQISTQLEKLKNEGYVLISNNKADNEKLKSLTVYKGSGMSLVADIYLLKDNYIKITFDKYEEYVSTLSPNFYNQFKAILTAKWEDVRGSLTETQDNGNSTKSLYYTSKKPLDRFIIEAMEDNKGNNKFVQAYINSYYPNVQLYSLISTELNKFKNEGYKVVQGNGADIGLADIAKMTSLYKGEKLVAEADLNKDSSIVILVAFPTSSPAPSPQKPKNLTRFQDEVTQKWGYKDERGNIIVQPIYDLGHDFWNGMALVNKGGVWGKNGIKGGKLGYIDNTGKVAIEPKYDDAGYFTEEMARVKLSNKWGFINKTDKIVIAFQYDDARSFVEGLAGIKLNDKWGFIDKTGKIVIEAIYDDVGDFSKGVALAKQYGKTIFINKVGNKIDKTLPSSTTTTNNKTTATTSTNISTLSPNFQKQFKAILNAKWEDVKGGFILKKDDKIAYYCKKPLDDFNIEAVEGIGGTLLPFFVCQDIGGFKTVGDVVAKGYGSKIVSAYPKNSSGGMNDVLFSKIKNELLKLQLNEGYTVLEHHFSYITDVAKAISLVRNNSLYATVILYTNKDILILFPY